MDAVTTILVQDQEILAASAQISAKDVNLITRAVVAVQDSEEGMCAIMGDLDKMSNIDHDPGTDLDMQLVDAGPVDPDANITFKAGLEVTAVTNPEFRDTVAHHGSPNIHGLIKCPDGRDLWPDVKNFPFLYITLRKPPSISDHARVLSSFLNEYRQSTYTDQQQLSMKFSYYLVTSCWRKLHNRMTHWSSLGLMTELATVDAKPILTKYVWTRHPPINDPALAAHLDHMIGGDAINDILFFHPSPVKPSLTKLLSRLPGSNLYDGETAMEFHDLTVATLLAFASSLTQLKIAVAKRTERIQKGFEELERKFWETQKALKKQSQAEWKEVKEAYYDDIAADQANEMHADVVASVFFVSLVARTLMAIAHSSALRLHLDILVKSVVGPLEMPIFQNKRRYLKFAQDREIINAEVTSQPQDEVISQVGANLHNVTTLQHDDEDEEIPFVGGLAQQPGVTYDGAVICRWLKMFIGHFSAKRELEKHCAKLPNDPSFDVNISLIAVKRTILPLPSWTEMMNIIKKLEFDSSSKSANAAATERSIDLLDKHIRHSRNRHRHPIFQRFEQLEHFASSPITKGTQAVKKPTFGCGLHCETVLASLAKFHDYAIKGDGGEQGALRNLCKDLYQGSISVSRLCCPCCWELLDILRENSTDFKVRGRHSTVSIVELPSWLPDTIVETMVQRFRNHLLDKLRHLKGPPRIIDPSVGLLNLTRNPSLQSDSGLSRTNESAVTVGTYREGIVNAFTEFSTTWRGRFFNQLSSKTT